MFPVKCKTRSRPRLHVILSTAHAAPQLALVAADGLEQLGLFRHDCHGSADQGQHGLRWPNIAASGWQYIIVDIQWYEPNGSRTSIIRQPQSNIDANGRLWPVTNKHPSATNNLGFKPLADYVHGKGLKFGIHHAWHPEARRNKTRPSSAPSISPATSPAPTALAGGIPTCSAWT